VERARWLSGIRRELRVLADTMDEAAQSDGSESLPRREQALPTE